jgi:hypothetical protein
MHIHVGNALRLDWREIITAPLVAAAKPKKRRSKAV